MEIKSGKKFLRLPSIIGNNMVLQRNTEIKLWGYATKGDTVEVEFLEKNYKTIANNSNKWELIIDELELCEPFDMYISTFDKIKIENVTVGDVWLCSGQSNMELPINRVKEKFSNEINKINNKNIRQFHIVSDYDFNNEKEDLFNGIWQMAIPDNIMNFSAVGYFFAEYLYKSNEIPIGIILNAVGGSPIQAWINEESIKKFTKYYNELDICKNKNFVKNTIEEDVEINNNWYYQINKNDCGLNSNLNWYDIIYNDENWDYIDLLADWNENDILNKNGVHWFRKSFYLTEELLQQKARIFMGRIVDADECYINGKFIGTTAYMYPPRIYSIPDGVLKKGINIVTMRVISNRAIGGFIKDKPYYIEFEKEKINLNGKWKYKNGCISKPLKEQTFFQYKPTGLYNAILYPLRNYKILGVLWYQGESNIDTYKDYKLLFDEMVKNWRQLFSNEKLPILFAQLAGYGEYSDFEPDNNLVKFRNIQSKCLEIENTGMNVIYDLGEWNDIHPLNKKEVGIRFAKVAKNIVYNENILLNPFISDVLYESNNLYLNLKNCDTGIRTCNFLNPSGFVLEYKNRKYKILEGKIQGNRIVFENCDLNNIKSIYYGWANFPKKANVINKELLPLRPFKYDLLDELLKPNV